MSTTSPSDAPPLPPGGGHEEGAPIPGGAPSPSLVEKVAGAISVACPGWDIAHPHASNGTRHFKLTYWDGSEPIECASLEEAFDRLSELKDLSRARAAIQAVQAEQAQDHKGWAFSSNGEELAFRHPAGVSISFDIEGAGYCILRGGNWEPGAHNATLNPDAAFEEILNHITSESCGVNDMVHKAAAWDQCDKSYKKGYAKGFAAAQAEQGQDISTGLLWCAHVRGPDDVLPMPSYEEAAKVCDRLNEISEKVRASGPDFPVVRAYPALWPHSSEAHAKAVRDGNREYGIAPAPSLSAEGEGNG